MRHPAPPPDADPLWTSQNPKHGIVRHVFVQNGYAARFDDLNGDCREVCLSLFASQSETWELVVYQDDVGYFPDIDDFLAGGGYYNPYVWAVGRGPGNTRIAITLFGRKHHVTTDADGWWLFAKKRAWPPTGRPPE